MKTLVFRKHTLEHEQILLISNQIRRHTLIDGKLVKVEEGLRPITTAVMLSNERREWTLEGHALEEHEVTARWPSVEHA
ncbi:hypothetical protein [Exiguobacterium sp. MH3]|uniref:hypothetical protein n=1 Tax=Exiguobacterium sp. MH3 TaxID=1399115 RepID=UPI0003C3AF4C|nr:hypothetical protein [Exiguobacterium sp. MH3]AHA31294.1 hypothetical protein U719_06590 [Exiguobacterium sp. MH3]